MSSGGTSPPRRLLRLFWKRLSYLLTSSPRLNLVVPYTWIAPFSCRPTITHRQQPLRFTSNSFIVRSPSLQTVHPGPASPCDDHSHFRQSCAGLRDTATQHARICTSHPAPSSFAVPYRPSSCHVHAPHYLIAAILYWRVVAFEAALAALSPLAEILILSLASHNVNLHCAG